MKELKVVLSIMAYAIGSKAVPTSGMVRPGEGKGFY